MRVRGVADVRQQQQVAVGLVTVSHLPWRRRRHFASAGLEASPLAPHGSMRGRRGLQVDARARARSRLSFALGGARGPRRRLAGLLRGSARADRVSLGLARAGPAVGLSTAAGGGAVVDSAGTKADDFHSGARRRQLSRARAPR